MKKVKSLVVANWKMNPETIEKAKEIFKGTKAIAKDLKNTKVVICPPFVYLSDLEKINDSKVLIGAQDMFWENAGSFTGEISPIMLKKEGESYVILGHSERRELGETEEMIAKKIASAIKAGLTPILCIGEKERDIHGEYLHSLRKQIINSLGKLPKRFLAKLIVAYEPIWAIGKSEEEAMKPTDLHEMTIFIKKILVEIYGQVVGMTVSILYGGSVNHSNAKDILVHGQVQGLLVGRESLNPKKFGELLRDVDSI
jgi:triosephosphate isomerase